MSRTTQSRALTETRAASTPARPRSASSATWPCLRAIAKFPLVGLLFTAMVQLACAHPGTKADSLPPKLMASMSTGVEARLPSLPSGLDDLLKPCVSPSWDQGDLDLGLRRALDDRDPRCWTAIELALADALLKQALTLDRPIKPGAERPASATKRTSRETREALLIQVELHARQAELRATRHGHYDLAALSHMLRARVSMTHGDRPGTLHQLRLAAEGATLWASAGEDHGEALDIIFKRLLIEALAAFELDLDDKAEAEADQHFELATAALTQLSGREALRGFQSAGIGPVALAELADRPEAAKLLAEFGTLRKQAQTAWGPAVRSVAPKLASLAETLTQNGPGWIASDPLLLEWLPGNLEGTASAAAAVLAPGEALLLYASGEKAGVLMVLKSKQREVFPLAATPQLMRLLDACVASPAAPVPTVAAHEAPAKTKTTMASQTSLPARCLPLRQEVIGPAHALLQDTRQLLVVASGPLHALPFEQLLPSVRVVRVPSMLSLPALRLRAWQGKPSAHRAALDVLPALRALGQDPAGPSDALAEALRARLRLDAGAHLVSAAQVSGGKVFGAPLTVPALTTDEDTGDPQGSVQDVDSPKFAK